MLLRGELGRRYDKKVQGRLRLKLDGWLADGFNPVACFEAIRVPGIRKKEDGSSQ